jgi:predicted Zn-dependent protease
VGAPPADPPDLHRAALRTASRARPLTAPTGDPGPLRERASGRPRPGRIRRFVRRYGWRAYAVPLLTVATLIALVDLALTTPQTTADATASTTAPTTESAQASAVSARPRDPLPPPPAQGDAGPAPSPQVVGAETYVEQGAGTLTAVDGSSPVYGSGPLRRFVVEVEDGIGVDGPTFAAAVEATLSDPRSWGNAGRMSFQRVGAAEAATSQYEFKVSLVSPGSMERYCPGVGTGGYTSCRYGERAVINLARWATAVPHYDGDIETYRHYVVNHEVGHVLGNGHVNCPGAGQIAPVMQQQTLGLQGCVKNAWPYP